MQDMGSMGSDKGREVRGATDGEEGIRLVKPSFPSSCNMTHWRQEHLRSEAILYWSMCCPFSQLHCSPLLIHSIRCASHYHLNATTLTSSSSFILLDQLMAC